MNRNDLLYSPVYKPIISYMHLPIQIVTVQISRMNVQLQMLIAEPQSAHTKYHGLDNARRAGFHQIVTSLRTANESTCIIF